MIYFIVQDWQNTHGNHAGMVHLCNEIKKLATTEVKVFVIPNVRIKNRDIRILQNILYVMVAILLIFRVKNGSKVFLMEYLLPTHNQYFIVKFLRIFKTVKLYGLAHLVPSDLNQYYAGNYERLISWIKPLDKILTLGTSLSKFLMGKGISNNKICTLFHYVDLDYYRIENIPPRVQTKMLKVIIMGSMKRDIKTIENIMNRVSNVHFIYCCGKKKIDKSIFKHPQNITLCGFVPEEELKALMNESDISLNVMIDTIGSNVITTSLAMGLAMVVSDVGSIRDYCNASNAIFCQSEDDFIEAIKLLTNKREKLDSMKTASGHIAQKFSVSNFYNEIQNI